MAEKDKRELKVTSNLSLETVKVITESVGIGNLSDEACTLLAEDTTYRLKQMVQVCKLLDLETNNNQTKPLVPVLR